MLDDLIRRDDVSKMLVDICNSARYYNKRTSSSLGYQMYSGSEQLLFLFYDALFKYKVIIDDMSYFSEFLEQVDKVIRKIDSFSEIGFGINRIIGRIVAYQLGYTDLESESVKEAVLSYIYDKYILNGYYIHGFSSHYGKSILETGFIVEDYKNLYPKFIKLQEILKKKKHFSILDKDFNLKMVSFTDNFLMGCYYSANSPMYFSKMICRNEYVNESEDVDSYSLGNYDLCLKNLYKLCSKLKLRDYQKNMFLDVFKSEWKLLDKSNCGLALMLVPRRSLGVNFDIERFVEECRDLSFAESVCKMLGQKSNINVSKYIKIDDIKLVNLYNINKYVKEEKRDSFATELEKTFIRSDDEFAFSNTYGKVSIMLILGTLFITIGVIITMISFG